MAISYTKGMLIERVKKHLANGFPNSSFVITDNEVLLYIDASIPFIMKGQMFENAKVTGFLEVPDAYIVTYALPTLTISSTTGEWFATLPQTPIELPTGYSITDVYFSMNGAKSFSALPLTNKRNTFRNLLPRPSVVFFRVESNVIYFQTGNGILLFNQHAYVQMPISRTSDKNAIMSLPDGALEMLFDKTVAKCLQRLQIPQDIVKDNLPSGNKTS